MAKGGGDVRWTVVDDQFPSIIAKMRAQADTIVMKAAQDIQAHAQTRAPVDTGNLRGSIQAHRVGHARARVTVGAEYGLYVEYGTSRMAPRPFLIPALNVVRPQFAAAMRKVVTR